MILPLPVASERLKVGCPNNSTLPLPEIETSALISAVIRAPPLPIVSISADFATRFFSRATPEPVLLNPTVSTAPVAVTLPLPVIVNRNWRWLMSVNVRFALLRSFQSVIAGPVKSISSLDEAGSQSKLNAPFSMRT